jgi:hypothetical protein
VIDRRHANVWRPIDGRTRGWALMPATLQFSNLAQSGGPGDSTAVNVVKNIVTLASEQASAQTVIGMSMAPCASGSHLSGLAEDQSTGMMAAVLWDNASTRNVRILHYTVAAQAASTIAGFWDDPDNGSAVNAVSASGLLDVALVALPKNSGNTHLLVYVDSAGDLIARTTTDNGATWSSATTIWAVASTDTLSKVSACLTRMGRIVVAGVLSAGDRIRYIYSDDLGATWLTNTNAGFSSSLATDTPTDIAVVEDDGGNLWTVYSIANTNRLRMFRGQAEGNPVPSGTEHSAAWKVGPDSTTVTTHIDAFPLPNGVIGVLYGQTASSGGDDVIGYVSIARRVILSHQNLVIYPLSANFGTSETVPLCCGVAASGEVHMAWGNRYIDGGSNYDLEFSASLYVPVEVPRAKVWYGGQ